MSKQNRDRLEEFFNKGTQKYDFEFNEADWKKLEEKLDQVDGGGAVPYWKANGRKFLLAGLIALVSLLALFFIVDPDRSLTGDEMDNISSVESNSDPSNTIHENQNDNKEIKNETTSEALNKKITKNENVESESQISSSAHKVSKEGDQSNQTKQSKISKSSLSNGVVRNIAGSDNGSVGEYDTSSLNKSIPGDGSSSRSNVSIPFLAAIGLNTDFSPYEFIVPEWNTDEFQEENNVIDKEKAGKDEFSSNLAVSVNVAPDFSTVGLGNFTTPGTRIGMVLSYQFHKRWSVRAGAIMTNNIYTARGDQYDAPAQWYGGEKPIRADGACKIVDVPVNLRYNYLLSNKNTFYLSAGVSSYFMLKEKYDFEYEYPSSYYMDNWESKETSKHMFGVVNISTGWEHRLAPKWSLQAEPFVNIPVTGIGWGEVDLYSFGSYFSLKYRLYEK